MRALAAIAIVCLTMSSAHAADPVLLHAAGSLRGALTDVAKAFEAASGVAVQAKYGPSGTLRDEIAGGAKAEVFASANMEHPASLAKANRSGPVVLFVRNRLCALVKPGLVVTPANLLDLMLRNDVKVGTSTPKADPSGDYAFEVFAKAEVVKPGSRSRWRRKRCSSPVVPQACSHPPAAASMAGMSTKDARTFSSPTARMRSLRCARMQANRSWHCRKRSRSGRITD